MGPKQIFSLFTDEIGHIPVTFEADLNTANPADIKQATCITIPRAE